MDKRVIVFLVLSLAIILGWDLVVKQFGLMPVPAREEGEPGRPSGEGPSDAVQPAGRSSAVEPPAKAEEVPASVSGPSGEGKTTVAEATATGGEESEEVVTDMYRAVFSSRGGELKSWELRRYVTSGTDPALPVQLMHKEGKFRRPLALQVKEPSLDKTLGQSLYRVERDFSTLDEGHRTGHLTFHYADGARGLRVEKQLTFHFNSYVVDVAIRTEGLQEGFDVALGTNFGIVEWGEGFIGLIGPASVVDDKLEKETPDNEAERKGKVRWLALQDKYFLSVLIPQGAAAVVVNKEGNKLVSTRARYGAGSSGGVANLQLYAGPKEYDTLRAFNLGLEDTIDFGWFIYGSWDIVRAVAKPLFSVLRFLYEFTHNYGIAIILLTVGLKLLFVPLQYKSYKSMKDMQLIQPKVAALQQKYKDDRERLNKELIKLYRDHKVNPVGGCLPMLLQTPVFVALFNILYMTIDLRQAPFFLWIKDLSVQDPYYVLPVIMGITMVLQQKIMPTTMDPTQAKVMLILPAFMTILFLTFPAGLVLYWLTNNVLTISQQVITDRYVFKRRPEVAAGVDAATETKGSS